LENKASTIQTFSLKQFLSVHYPLLAVLAGFLMVSLSLGPYTNGDTQWEMDAVAGVLNTGLPYANGYLMDQPPLGFYFQALWFTAFGVSIGNGVFLVTLFGLGCVALVYGLGCLLYSRTAGFFAALLFAFSPWHLILSRTFLIDVPCLFFTLLSLFVGLVALKKDSFRLFVAAGIVFAVAFNTKLYAVYMLIPLLIFLYRHKHNNPKRFVIWFAAFILPVLVASIVWYEIVTGSDLYAIFLHTDFSVPIPDLANPTPFFATNFLVSYGLGWFFLDAVLLSVVFSLWQRRLFRGFRLSDATCVVVIVCVLCVNIFLGAILDLKAPFLNTIKYSYQALPLFCLLGASIVIKSSPLLKVGWLSAGLRKPFFVGLAVLGFSLVAAAVFYNMYFVHLFSTWEYLIFKVDPTINVGYSLFNFQPITAESSLMFLQYLGFALGLSGAIWVSRNKIILLLKKIHVVL
jgi:4-amino-4-deoxy-L-arabinose transferase-like glycosyltransferase